MWKIDGEPGVKKVGKDLAEGSPEDTQYVQSVIDNIISAQEKEDADKLALQIRADAEFDLDGCLDSYDPTFPGYIPSRNALDMMNMMRMVQGGDFEFDTPIAHYFMCDLLLNEITDPQMFPYSKEICDTIEINHLRLAFMCSRGVAKSTMVISFFGVYSAIKGKLPNGIGPVWFYLVVAASSRGGARVNALAVRAMCEDSVFLKDYFEDMRFTESESEFVRKGTCPKKDRSFLIRYQGAGTGIRGIRYGERRICAILFDDIILNEAAAYSKTIQENLFSMVSADAGAALKGGFKGRIINCFTPFNYSELNTASVLNGSYTPCVIPISNALDVDDLSLKHTDIISSWESMHPAKSILSMIKEARKSKTLKSFSQERSLRLTSNAERLIPDDCLQFCDMSLIERNLHAYNIYITTDFTTTSGEKSDFSGRAVWAVSNNEDYFMLGLTLRKMGFDEQYNGCIDDATSYKRRGKHVEIGVETDGNQAAHIHALEQIMLKRGDWHTFARPKSDPNTKRKGILSRGTGVDKHERFRIASNVILAKKMWLPQHLKDTPDMVEFLAQVRGATHEKFARADDGPDLVTMAMVSMYVIYPNAGDGVDIDAIDKIERDKYVLDYWGDDDDIDEVRTGSTIF